MRFLNISLMVLIVMMLISGCSKADAGMTTKEPAKDNNKPVVFTSIEYDFSFSYPSGWETVTKDLPDNWAMLDKDKNTILFVVAKAKSKDLLTLGRSLALGDLFPGNKVTEIKVEQLREVAQMVKLAAFNERQWYTYGVKFQEKNVESIVSGTVCGENEVTMVMVSSNASYEKNKAIYTSMLESFNC